MRHPAGALDRSRDDRRDVNLEEAMAFAAKDARGLLLTINPDGMTHASNIFYASFDDSLRPQSASAVPIGLASSKPGIS